MRLYEVGNSEGLHVYIKALNTRQARKMACRHTAMQPWIQSCNKSGLNGFARLKAEQVSDGLPNDERGAF